MNNDTEYEKGHYLTMKLAGLSHRHENNYGSGGATGGMIAGSVLGGRLGERIARNSRTELLGVPLPFTESVDPDRARTIGTLVGATGGGILGHNYGSATGKIVDIGESYNL